MQKKTQKSSQITVCHVQKLRIVRECDGLLSKVWINTAQHSEELQFIFEEYWPVLIHSLVLAFSPGLFHFQVPGLLYFFGPGTTGPRDLQGL